MTNFWRNKKMFYGILYLRCSFIARILKIINCLYYSVVLYKIYMHVKQNVISLHVQCHEIMFTYCTPVYMYYHF